MKLDVSEYASPWFTICAKENFEGQKSLAIPYIFILTSRAEVANQKHEEQ